MATLIDPRMVDPGSALGDTADWPSIDYRRLTPASREQVDRWIYQMSQRLGLRTLPTLRQLAVYTTAARNMTHPILFGGGMGGGKSYLLAQLAFWLGEQVPQNYIAAVRQERERFTETTLKAFVKVHAHYPDWYHMPGKSSFFNKANGSEIHYMGVKDIERVRSAEWGSLLFDEITDGTRDDFNIMKSRVRLPQAASHPQNGCDYRMIVCTCNPLPGWVKEDWISLPQPGYVFIRSLALDNWYGAPDYIEEMRASQPPHLFDAYISGDWDALSESNAALPQDMLTAMMSNTTEPQEPEDTHWGIDVGHRGGDATVITARSGWVFEHVDEWVQARTTTTRQRILRHFEGARYQPRSINIDCTGVGAGLGDQLVEESWKGNLGDCAIHEVHASGHDGIPAAQTRQYASIKAYHVFLLRKIGEAHRGRLPSDPRYRRDLAAIASHERGGKTYVDNNEVVRSKNGTSPNWGDSLLLSLFEGRRDYIPAAPPSPAEALEGPDERQRRLQYEEERRRRTRGPANFFQQFAGANPFSEDGDDLDVGY